MLPSTQITAHFCQQSSIDGQCAFHGYDEYGQTVRCTNSAFAQLPPQITSNYEWNNSIQPPSPSVSGMSTESNSTTLGHPYQIMEVESPDDTKQTPKTQPKQIDHALSVEDSEEEDDMSPSAFQTPELNISGQLSNHLAKLRREGKIPMPTLGGKPLNTVNLGRSAVTIKRNKDTP